MVSLSNEIKEYLSESFSGLSCSGEEFSKVEFDSCVFTECDFSDAHFNHCKFIDCHFVRSNVSNAKLNWSKFNDVLFEDCKVIGLDWTRASWQALIFGAPIGFKRCILNDSSFFGLALAELLVEDCKAYDVDFRTAALNQSNFTYSDLSSSLFGKTDLKGADFTEAVNYDINIFDNDIKGAKFTRLEASRLLECLEIELLD